MVAGNGPIRRLCVVDVRQSMANGGGPACLRLRVVADPATVDPRFLVDEAKLDRIAALRRGASGPSGSRPTTSPTRPVGADRGGALGPAFDLLDLAELA